MQLTFVNDMGQSFVVEIDPNMELENVTALLEADSGIPQSEQVLIYEGRQLTNPKATMLQLGVADNAMVLVSRRQNRPPQQQQQQQRQQQQMGGGPDEETTRLRILGDPNLMQQLRDTQPDLAAAIHDPARFRQYMQQTDERRYEADLERQREIAKLNNDPFDIEAQRKIEELIRREAVEENMAHALEYSPESFGRVTMLYIPVEVNGHKVKAFVDSGAQMTIMSPSCAEKCNIMRLVDNRFAGIARGAGEAKILGKVHSAQLKLADLHLPCSFSVMESRDVDLLFGLDMLKAHQACIDLEKNVLRIQGREVRFLSEHELPVQAHEEAAEAQSRAHASTSNAPPITAPSSSSQPAPAPASGSGSAPDSRHPEQHIKTLMDLGADRQTAISTLDAAAGNIDVAASLLFSM